MIESWCVACLVGDVALWKDVMNLLLAGVEYVQPVRLHEIYGCIRSLFNFLHSFRLAYVGWKVLRSRL
jgi:hypothetical protein